MSDREMSMLIATEPEVIDGWDRRLRAQAIRELQTEIRRLQAGLTALAHALEEASVYCVTTRDALSHPGGGESG